MVKRIQVCGLLALLIAWTAGCATKTDYVPPNRSKLQDLSRLAVYVSEFPAFKFFDLTQNVTLREALSRPAIYGQEKDSYYQKALNPQGRIAPRSLLAGSVKSALVAHNKLDDIGFVSQPNPKSNPSGYDAVVSIDVDDWGVRMMPPRDPTYCWLWIKLDLLVKHQTSGDVLLNDTITVAKRSDEPKENFLAEPSRLADLFREMIHTAGKRVGNLFVK